MKKLFSVLPMLSIALLTSAQETAVPAVPEQAASDIYANLLLIAVLTTFVLALIVALLLLQTVKLVSQKVLGTETPDVTPDLAAAPKTGVLARILQLRPVSEEREIMMEHEFDGIAELDNPTPGWFMWLFYATIVFAISYMAYFHVFHFGKMQEEEYAIELKTAAAENEAYLAKSGDKIDENSVAQSNDDAVLKSGQAIFKANCVACHGDNAQGVVGPNLTDEFWLHGGNINSIFKSVKYGVPEKGMISWEKTLSPKQISDVSNYILSLKGSKPANPKEPQGTKEL